MTKKPLKPGVQMEALPEQAACIRMVTSLMMLQAGGFVSDDEYMTIRTRICRWDLDGVSSTEQRRDAALKWRAEKRKAG